MKKLNMILVILVTISSSFVYAHSGRTDVNGCHHDRQTGTYHCH